MMGSRSQRGLHNAVDRIVELSDDVIRCAVEVDILTKQLRLHRSMLSRKVETVNAEHTDSIHHRSAVFGSVDDLVPSSVRKRCMRHDVCHTRMTGAVKIHRQIPGSKLKDSQAKPALDSL